MEVKNWSYEEYPEYRTTIPEAKIVDTTGDEVFVTYHPDIPYAVMDGHVLTLQILTPQTRNEPDKMYPVILYVQGSHWDKQNVYSGVPELSRLASYGYVTAIVQYRGYDLAPFPATLVDTRNAVRFMKLHAEEYHGDPENIFLSGSSSGGHAAVYAPIYDGEEENQYPGTGTEVRGIIDFYGSVSVMKEDSNPTTIDHCLPDSPEGMEMGHVNLRERMDLRRKLSVECQITKDTNIPPVLILHGTKDRTVNPEGSEVLYKKLKACGKDAEIVFIRGADHGGGEFWSDPVLKIVDRFVRTNLVRRKQYHFYGSDRRQAMLSVHPLQETFGTIRNPYDLYDALCSVWSADTCAPRLREKWTLENPTLGQCSITAFLAQDIFGGKVYGVLRPAGNYHCYNIVNGVTFDLTSEQFGEEKLDYTKGVEQSRDAHFSKAEKKERYEILKTRLMQKMRIS